jgi:hypothetical protein
MAVTYLLEAYIFERTNNRFLQRLIIPAPQHGSDFGYSEHPVDEIVMVHDLR